MSPPVDVLPLVWDKITEGSPVLALAERPDLPGDWTLVCALRINRLADLCTGTIGLWTDLDHTERIDGPQLRIVFQPEAGSTLESAWSKKNPDTGYGHAEWPYAVPIDLSNHARREAVARLVDEGCVRIVWIDLADGTVVTRHEVALTDLNRQTLTRVLDAAAQRWPREDD